MKPSNETLLNKNLIFNIKNLFMRVKLAKDYTTRVLRKVERRKQVWAVRMIRNVLICNSLYFTLIEGSMEAKELKRKNLKKEETKEHIIVDMFYIY